MLLGPHIKVQSRISRQCVQRLRHSTVLYLRQCIVYYISLRQYVMSKNKYDRLSNSKYRLSCVVKCMLGNFTNKVFKSFITIVIVSVYKTIIINT